MARWKCLRAKDWVGTTCKLGSNKIFLADQGEIAMFPSEITPRCIGQPGTKGAFCYFTEAGYKKGVTAQRKGLKEMVRTGRIRLL